MISKTVGVAGDYPSWKEAYDFLVSLGALVNDYEFRQISDCTINDNWLPAPQVNTNGHTVKFYVAWADSHQGDPTKGFVTYVNGVNGRIYFGILAGATGSFIVDGMYMIQTTHSNTTLIWVAPQTAVFTVIQKNLLIKGENSNIGRGLAWALGQLITVHISNCKIWNIEIPFVGNFVTGSGASGLGLHVAENITIGQHGSFGFSLSAALGYEWILRNCVATGGKPLDPFTPTYDYPAGTGTRHKVYNCAGSDGTLTTANYLVKDDIQDNIVEVDEFASVADTDADFWFLKPGSVAVSFTRDPNGTLWVNQECQFDPEVLITPGALRLGETGIAPTLTTLDIAGKPRPGPVGFYSIGAHEQQYG